MPAVRVVAPTVAATGSYKNRMLRSASYTPIGQDRPPFSPNWVPYMLMCPTVRLGFQMRVGPIAASTFTVEAEPAVAQFVKDNLQAIWDVSAALCIQTAEAFGHVGGEVVYEERDGLVQFKDFLDFALWDSQPLVEERTNELAGVFVKQGMPQQTRLEGMKGFWFHAGTSNRDYAGESILLSAFSPWLDLELPFGLESAARLWYTRNPFSGGIIKYPEGWQPVFDANGNPTGDKRRNEDLALEYTANMMAGAGITMPSGTDAAGNPLWHYEPPSANNPPTDMLEERSEKKRDIWRGMGIQDEIVVASQTGSGFSGRDIPNQSFLKSLERVRQRFWRAVQKQIMDRLVRWNFGPGAKYKVEFAPLSGAAPQADMMPDQQGGPSSGAQANGGPANDDSGQFGGQQAQQAKEFALTQDRFERLERMLTETTRQLMESKQSRIEMALESVQAAVTAPPKTDAVAEALTRLSEAVAKMQPAPVNVNVPERQTIVNNTTTVPERSVTVNTPVDARTTVEKGAVQADVDARTTIGDLNAKIEAKLNAELQATVALPPRPPATAEFRFTNDSKGNPESARGVIGG